MTSSDPNRMDLETHVRRLLAWLAELGISVPPHDDVRVLDSRAPGVSYEGGPEAGWRLPSLDLPTVAEFAPIFDDYMERGYSWINLQTYGIHGRSLILGVERALEAMQVPVGRTAVMYGGPPLNLPGEGLRWSVRLKLTDRPVPTTRGPSAEDLIAYFEHQSRKQPHVEHWWRGRDLARRWARLVDDTEPATQEVVDRLSSDLAAEEEPGSGWFDLWLQVRHWATSRGFEFPQRNPWAR